MCSSIGCTFTGTGRDGRDLRRFAVRGGRNAMRIDDNVHAALAVEHDLARAMARDWPEADRLQHLPQSLRAWRCVFDELDAFDAERVAGFEDCLSIQGRHRYVL
jgi:hypothetical protein